MIRMKPIAAALAAIGMVAVVSPAQAGEVEDLKAAMKKMMERIDQLEAKQKSQAPVAQAAPAAVPANVVTTGTLPNSVKIPGTETSLRVYGYAQMDATYDLKGKIPAGNGDANGYNADSYDWASFVAAQPINSTPEGKRKKQLYTTMKTSRLGLETSTPTGGYGDLKVKLEGDFNAPNAFQGESQTNSVLFRLRHAYGEVGNVLVGQTWSNFLDLGSFADTVDFNGPGAVPMIRQPQARYTFPLSASSKLAVSLENPQSGAGKLPGSTGSTNSDKRPDITANYTQSFKDGHFSVRAVTLNYNTDRNNKQAFGFGAGGSYKLGKDDTLVAQVNGGKGIGRYMLNSFLQSAVDTGSDIDLWKAVGGHIGYTHAWTPGLRSNVIAAYTKFSGDRTLEGIRTVDADDNRTPTNDPNKKIKEVSVNTFWSPVKNTELGLEYAWGQRETFDGDKGTQSRVNATARFSLF